MCAVVVASEGPDETLACLRALGELPVVLVDNGADVADPGPRVDRVVPSRNVGAAAGRNLGMTRPAARDAEVILFLDSDAEVSEHAVELMAATLREDDSLAAVGATIVDWAAPGTVWTAGGSVTPGGEAVSLHAGRPVADVPAAPYEVEWTPTCAMLARRRALEAVGGFDESYFVYYEDSDWCLRARAAGWRILQVPAAVVAHRAHGSQGGEAGSPSRIYWMTRNGLRFRRRWVGRRAAAVAAAGELRLAAHEWRAGRRQAARARARGVRDAGLTRPARGASCPR